MTQLRGVPLAQIVLLQLRGTKRCCLSYIVSIETSILHSKPEGPFASIWSHTTRGLLVCLGEEETKKRHGAQKSLGTLDQAFKRRQALACGARRWGQKILLELKKLGTSSYGFLF